MRTTTVFGPCIGTMNLTIRRMIPFIRNFRLLLRARNQVPETDKTNDRQITKRRFGQGSAVGSGY